MNDLFNLSGRIAIVTGGGGLLASEHATALSNYGATVVLADVKKDKCDDAVAKLSAKNINALSKYCDVTSLESWNLLLKEVIDEFGKADILINNAGFTNQSRSANFDAPFENFRLEDWNAIINVNLTGTFLGCQVIGKQMLQQGKGAIINIASLYGVVSPNHRIYPDTGITQPVAYSVSKHGVIGLTKYLATLWAEKGVRVNSLTPGGIYNNHQQLFLERFEQLNPIGRMSNKDEFHGAVVYLASDASSHVVGHNLIVDGGWTAW
jgi:NAD(P)-dependent dehydrogenase (short-subunit alcohol dehydrogenase family)